MLLSLILALLLTFPEKPKEHTVAFQYVLPESWAIPNTEEDGALADQDDQATLDPVPLVNENVGATEPPTHDADTTFVQPFLSSGVLIVQFQKHGVSHQGQIRALGIAVVARRGSGTGQSIDAAIGTGWGTLEDAANALATPLIASQLITDSYVVYSATTPTDPATGQPWTPAAIQKYMAIVALNGAQAYVTQVYGIIEYDAPTWTERGADYGVAD